MSSAQPARPSGRQWRGQPLAVLVVLAITGALLLLTPWWSGLDTPDSEFYLSLSVFTDQVTDRAVVDSYFWTRLGYIAPAHILTSFAGIWIGFALWKAVLLLAIVGSVFDVTRRYTSLARAAWLTAAVCSSSVLLAYLGNSYITAPVMAGTAMLTMLAIRHTTLTYPASGLVLGWMAMTYPGGALLGGSIWIALTLHGWSATKEPRGTRARNLGIAAGSTIAALMIFLAVGRWLFPGLDWLSTNLEAAKFDYGVYSSGTWVWLTDISLLVPASVMIISIANWWAARQSQAAQLAMIITLTSIGFMLTYSIFFGAHFLEAPPSQAMLWPPAMIALSLVGASRMTDPSARSVLHAGVAALGLVLIIAAGHVDPQLQLPLGVGIAAVLIALVLLAPRMSLAAMITMSALLAGAQLLQNSREPMGQFMLSPYTWAYRDNPVEEKLRIAVNAQQWVLDNSSDKDRIMQWVEGQWTQGDRELYTVASMQLWGPNLITLEPILDDVYGLPNLKKYQPSMIEMNGKSMTSVYNFWASIPANLSPTPPQCYDYTWPDDPRANFPTSIGHTCLTRLTW